ncbi:MAG: hypothetical protein ACXV48_07415, partial [Halobacteriota archaeon]
RPLTRHDDIDRGCYHHGIPLQYGNHMPNRNYYPTGERELPQPLEIGSTPHGRRDIYGDE